MKAIVHHKYGSPDVLEHEEAQKPTLRDDEVLMKIHAASTNPGDLHLPRVEQVFFRLAGFGFL